MTSKFKLVEMSVNRQLEWTRKEIVVPNTSEALVFDGSGKAEIKKAVETWQTGDTADTSRAIFSGFVDSIIANTDLKSVGSPQLGTLYRIGPGKLLGIVHDQRRYFAGTRLLGNEAVCEIEWRNALFERADGAAKKRLPSAQAHKRPAFPENSSS